MNASSLTSTTPCKSVFKDTKRYKTTVAGTCSMNIFCSPYNLVLSFSSFPLHSSQAISSPEIRAKISSSITRNQGRKARKEQQVDKDKLSSKIIYGKCMKLERDQDMTPPNKLLWHQIYFELKAFEYLISFICLKTEPPKRNKSPALKQP